MLFKIDKNLAVFLNHLPHSGFLKVFFDVIELLSNNSFIWFILVVIFLIFDRKNWKKILFYLTVAVLVWISHLLFKSLFDRPRPFEVLDITKFANDVKYSSFPSGHTTNSFAFSTAFSLLYPQRKLLNVLFFIFAILVAISRIYLGAHFPSDVLAGAVLGIFGVLLTNKFFTKFFKLKFLNSSVEKSR